MDRKKARKYLEKEKDGQRRHNGMGVKEHSLNFCDAREERTEHSKFSCVLHFTVSLPIAVMWLNMAQNLCDSYKLRGSQPLSMSGWP